MQKKLYCLLINIKNSQISNKKFLLQKKNNVYINVLNLLWNNGYILCYCIVKTGLKISLKYINFKPVIKFIKLIFKHNKKLFFSVKQLWKLNQNMFFIISTNYGLKSLNACKKENIGGKLLLIIF